MSDDDPVSYVRELNIPSPSDAIAAAADSGHQSFVAGGSLIAIGHDIGKRQRSDVLCSTLLAQLSADYWYERQYQTSQWYKKYVEVLASVGWDIQSCQFEEYNTSDPSDQVLQISTAVLDVIRDIGGKAALYDVKNTIEMLKDPANQDWWDVFSKKSVDFFLNGNFQVLPCIVDSNDHMVIPMSCFYCNTSNTSTATEERWFWSQYTTANISIHKATQMSTLNMDVYGQVRQEIIEKLGDNVTKYIGDLKINLEGARK